jgi:hypothetical protein
MTRTFVLAALLTAACAASVRAAESAPPLKATTKDAFSAVVVELHKEMQEGGRYAYVTERERADVEKELDRMRALLEKSGSVDTMGKDDQVALFNAQESVNATLEKRDRDRLVCERAATTGSRIATTQCRTYGEIEADREAGRKLMREKAARGCTKPGCKQG